MKTRSIILSLVTAGLLAFSNPASAGNSPKDSPCEFRADMRKLWEDHLIWTRNVIYNIINDAPGLNEAVNRLLANQDEIGDALKPFYGEAAGENVASLLRDHITIAADILVALKTGDSAGLTQSYNEWVANADAIATLLSSVNPNWTFEELQHMLHEHLELTAAEAISRFEGRFADEVVIFEETHLEILEMSDLLANGIIEQFPSKFSGRKSAEFISLTNELPVSLKQNFPNPFTSSTTISYYVPEHITDAKIIFYDQRGNQIRLFEIKEKGEGTLHIDAQSLSTGMYSYCIIADGKIIETMKMVRD